MDKIKIERINQLARKAKQEGLTEEEKLEQKTLREQYIAEFKQSLAGTLDSLVIVDKNGNRRKVSKKAIN